MMIKIAWKHIRSRPISGLLTIIGITLVLTLLGSFWALRDNLSQVQNTSNETPSVINVFLKEDILNAEVKRITALLQASELVDTARVVSSEEAHKEFQAQFGETLSKAVNADSLPIMISASIKPGSFDRDRIVSFLNQVRAQSSVLEVDAGDAFSTGILASSTETKVINWAFLLFALVFVVVSLLISHIIRLAFEGNRNDIETLKVLGASNMWIFIPVLLEALFYGLVSAALTVIALNLSIQMLLPTFASHLLPKNFEFFTLSVSSWASVLGVALGASLLGALMTWPLIQKPARRT